MNDLFLLIKSMKQGEKRYFTLSASAMVASKKNNYLKLFEVLDSLKTYDEDFILKKYRKQPFIKNYAANKSYLYDMLLAVLRNYNEDTIEEWDIRRNFYKLKILASKGLDKACEKLMIKTKEKAWQYEQYNTLLDIIDLEMYLFGNCRIGDMNKDRFWDIKTEKDRVYKILNEFKEVHSYWHQLNILFINQLNEPFEEIVKQAERIIRQLQLNQEPGENFSLSLRNRYLACFELFFNNVGDVENCYEYNKKLIENRKLIDERMPNFSVDAMAVYFNFMIACYKFEKWDEMEIYLLKTEQYPVKSIEQEIRRTHNYCYNGILLYLETSQMDKAAKIVETFFKAKDDFEGRYRVDFLLFTLCHCGWYYFLKKDYNKAEEIWREIMQGPKYNLEIRTQATTRLYLLITYFNQKNDLLFESELINTRRYLKKHFLLNKNEQLFLDSLGKLNHSKNDRVVMSELSELIRLNGQLLTEKNIVNRFIIHWVEGMKK